MTFFDARSVFLLLLASCSAMNTAEKNPEVHGHRGCRGLLPENTLPAFFHAAELGCDWLEMDVVLSGDGQVVVSHEPWMDHHICLDRNGDTIAPGNGELLNLHRMTVADIQRFDCGSKPNERFPQQRSRKAFKPTLREVVEGVDEHVLLNGGTHVNYNIEIKSRPEWYGVFQPGPETLAERVLATIDSLGIAERSMIQSFDPAVLEAVKVLDEGITIALLVEDPISAQQGLERLSFRPDVYSPQFELLDAAQVTWLREQDIGVAVWTVNEVADMKRMIKLGVDGIITDHPDRLLRLLEND